MAPRAVGPKSTGLANGFFEGGTQVDGTKGRIGPPFKKVPLPKSTRHNTRQARQMRGGNGSSVCTWARKGMLRSLAGDNFGDRTLIFLMGSSNNSSVHGNLHCVETPGNIVSL